MTDALYLASLARAHPAATIEVAGDEGRHAAVVKRTRVGERVLVSDGCGRAIHGTVTEVTKQGIAVRVDEELSLPEPRHRWVAVQALAKGDRPDIAVESLTELGAAEIVAWQAARSVVRWDGKADKGVAKWQATARSSTKQSRRFTVPQVSYATTAEVIARIGAADLAVVAHEEAAGGIWEVELPTRGEVLVVIGPEGGIASGELAGLMAAGAIAVSLGSGVLRTSSAGVVALAQLQVLAQQAGLG